MEEMKRMDNIDKYYGVIPSGNNPMMILYTDENRVIKEDDFISLSSLPISISNIGDDNKVVFYCRTKNDEHLALVITKDTAYNENGKVIRQDYECTLHNASYRNIKVYKDSILTIDRMIITPKSNKDIIKMRKGITFEEIEELMNKIDWIK